MGTKNVIGDNPAFWQASLRENVSILAINEDKAEALAGLSCPLMASNMALDCSAALSLVLKGLFIARYIEEEGKRATQYPCCLALFWRLTSTSSVGRCATKIADSRGGFSAI